LEHRQNGFLKHCQNRVPAILVHYLLAIMMCPLANKQGEFKKEDVEDSKSEKADSKSQKASQTYFPMNVEEPDLQIRDAAYLVLFVIMANRMFASDLVENGDVATMAMMILNMLPDEGRFSLYCLFSSFFSFIRFEYHFGWNAVHVPKPAHVIHQRGNGACCSSPGHCTQYEPAHQGHRCHFPRISRSVIQLV
jgi:hypothetical protein